MADLSPVPIVITPDSSKNNQTSSFYAFILNLYQTLKRIISFLYAVFQGGHYLQHVTTIFNNRLASASSGSGGGEYDNYRYSPMSRAHGGQSDRGSPSAIHQSFSRRAADGCTENSRPGDLAGNMIRGEYRCNIIFLFFFSYSGLRDTWIRPWRHAYTQVSSFLFNRRKWIGFRFEEITQFHCSNKFHSVSCMR